MLEKKFLFVVKFALRGTHKTFVLCSPGCGRHPAEARVGTHPSTPTLWNISINFSCGFYFNADRIVSNICATAKTGRGKAKRKRKKKGKGSVCHGEADKFVEGKIHFRAPEWESQTKVNP